MNSASNESKGLLSFPWGGTSALLIKLKQHMVVSTYEFHQSYMSWFLTKTESMSKIKNMQTPQKCHSATHKTSIYESNCSHPVSWWSSLVTFILVCWLHLGWAFQSGSLFTIFFLKISGISYFTGLRSHLCHHVGPSVPIWDVWRVKRLHPSLCERKRNGIRELPFSPLQELA